nr:EOG090X0EEI [Cyclestheria hislopi]
MKPCYKLVVVLLISVTVVLCDKMTEESYVSNEKSDHNENSEDVFVPTKEWKHVKPGQAIPRGLHVRINLETGEREAKLLDEEKTDTDDTLTSAVLNLNPDIEETEQRDSSRRLDPEELKQSLKKIKQENIPEDGKQNTFRSYEELKKEMEKINLQIKSEYEIVKQLVQDYKNLKEDAKKVAVLNDLEFYMHQFDNALDFVKMGGFKNIVLPALNASGDGVRSAAAFLLGSASQSNPKVQIAALEMNALPHLIRLVSFDHDNDVRNKALYAISSIVRHFPLAQQALINHGGISTFAKIFATDSADLLKLQLKIVTLLSDLLMERNFAANHANDLVRNLQQLAGNESVGNASNSGQEKENLMKESEHNSEKLRQYDAVGLEKILVEQGYCFLFPRLLTQLRSDSKRTRREDLSSLHGRPLREEHDVVEKVVQAMLSLSRSCQKEFQLNRIVIQQLTDRYANLSKQEKGELMNTSAVETDSGDLYYTKLFNMCRKLSSDLKFHDEL